MAPHSSILAWRIPGTGEPGGLLSMGSHTVGHDWSDLAAEFNPFFKCVCLVTQFRPTLCDPMDVTHQAPLSMGFSRQGYYSGLPCPPPGDFPNLGIEPKSPTLEADSLPSEKLKTLEMEGKMDMLRVSTFLFQAQRILEEISHRSCSIFCLVVLSPTFRQVSFCF